MLEQNAREVPSPDDAEPRSEVSGTSNAQPEQYRRPNGDEIEALYKQYRKLLLFTACRKFRVPDADGESLIQEVFVSFMQVGTPIRDVRSWLVAAMCNASRHYWRAQGRTESLPADFGERSDPQSHTLGDSYVKKMTLQSAMLALRPRYRETLRLHYLLGYSAAEIAVEFDTTTRYAEKLIHTSLASLREVMSKIAGGQS